MGGFEEIVLSEDVFTNKLFDGIVLSNVNNADDDDDDEGDDDDDDDEEGRFKKTSNE